MLKDDPQLEEDCRRFGIEVNLTARWEKGTPHHPQSIALMGAIAQIDFTFCNDYFGWSTGGDGDTGETLMYEMDVYFELQDARLKERPS